MPYKYPSGNIAVPRKEPSVTNNPTQQKFPEDAANCDYDVFEEYADGSTVWRACVFGMSNTELKLRQLARESNNKFFAINLQDQTLPVVRLQSAFRASPSPAETDFRPAS